MLRQDTATFFNLAHSLRYIANLKSFLSWSKVCFVAGPKDRYVLPGKLRMVKRRQSVTSTYAPASNTFFPSSLSSIHPVFSAFPPYISIKTLASVPARNSSTVETVISYPTDKNVWPTLAKVKISPPDGVFVGVFNIYYEYFFLSDWFK